MKKNVLFFGFLLIIIFVGSINSVAQEPLRYIQTAIIDKDGNKKNIRLVTYFLFTGQRVKIYHRNVSPESMLTWAFHHKDGANSVYYRIYNNFVNGYEIDNNTVLVVSPDRKVLNWIAYDPSGQRKFTNVYHQQDEERHGTMEY